MHDPAAAVGAVYGDRRALDALLPGIGWRDLASIDLVVEIVARPEQAGIHIAQCMADLFVGRDLLPVRQCRMRSEERRVGKEWSVRVDLGGRRIIKKKIKKNTI